MLPLKRVVAFGCEESLRAMLKPDPHRVTLLTSRVAPARGPVGEEFMRENVVPLLRESA